MDKKIIRKSSKITKTVNNPGKGEYQTGKVYRISKNDMQETNLKPINQCKMSPVELAQAYDDR